MTPVLVIACPTRQAGPDGAGNGHLRVEVGVRMSGEKLRAPLATFERCDADGCTADVVVETTTVAEHP